MKTAMPPRQILVACIGNIFHGDDAFGVEVARRLAGRPMPAGVRVEDFGIRGIDLTYALLDGCDAAILVDAAPRGGAPGTLYVIEPPSIPAADAESGAGQMLEAHTLNPLNVLRAVRGMGGRVKHVLVVGCEPTPADPDEMAMGLTPAVQAALDPAVALIDSLVEKFVRDAEAAVPQP